MKPEDLNPENDMEVRITALLLGELTAEEAAEVQAAIAQDPELTRLHDRLKVVLGLVREAVPTAELPANAIPEPLTLADERRQELLAVFKGGSPKAKKIIKVSFWKRYQKDLLKLAAMVVALLGMGWLMVGKRDEEFKGMLEGESYPRGFARLKFSVERLFDSDSEYTATPPPPPASAAAAVEGASANMVAAMPPGANPYQYGLAEQNADGTVNLSIPVGGNSTLALESRADFSYAATTPGDRPQAQLSSRTPGSGERPLTRRRVAGDVTTFRREPEVVTGAAPIGKPQGAYVAESYITNMSSSLEYSARGPVSVITPARSSQIALPESAQVAQGKEPTDNYFGANVQNARRVSGGGDEKGGQVAQAGGAGGLGGGGVVAGTTHWGFGNQSGVANFTTPNIATYDSSKDIGGVAGRGGTVDINGGARSQQNAFGSGEKANLSTLGTTTFKRETALADGSAVQRTDGERFYRETAPTPMPVPASPSTSMAIASDKVDAWRQARQEYLPELRAKENAKGEALADENVAVGDRIYRDVNRNGRMEGMTLPTTPVQPASPANAAVALNFSSPTGAPAKSDVVAPGSMVISGRSGPNEAGLRNYYSNDLPAGQSRTDTPVYTHFAETAPGQTPLSPSVRVGRRIELGDAQKNVWYDNDNSGSIAGATVADPQWKGVLQNPAAGNQAQVGQVDGLAVIPLEGGGEKAGKTLTYSTDAPVAGKPGSGVPESAFIKGGLRSNLGVEVNAIPRVTAGASVPVTDFGTRAKAVEIGKDSGASYAVESEKLAKQQVDRFGAAVADGRKLSEPAPMVAMDLYATTKEAAKRQATETLMGEVSARAEVLKREGNLAEAERLELEAQKLGRRLAGSTTGLPSATKGNKEEASRLVQDAKLLQELRRGDEAEAKLKEALKQDPANSAAHYYLNLQQEAKYADIARKQDFEQRSKIVNVEKAWEIPVTRDSLAGANPDVRPNVAQTTTKSRNRTLTSLDQATVKEVFFDDQPPSKVVEALNEEAKKQGLDLAIKTDAASAATRVTINPPLKNLRLIDALDAVARVAQNEEGKKLAFQVNEGEVVMEQKTVEPTQLYTRVFKVDPKQFASNLESVTGVTVESLAVSGGGLGGGKAVAPLTVPRVSGATGGGIGGQAGVGITGVTTTVDSEEVNKLTRQFFAAAGVNMSSNANGPSTQVFYNDRTGTLMVRASEQDLEIIESAVEVLNIDPPQVQAEAKFADVKQSMLPKPPVVVEELAKLSDENKPVAALQQLVEQKEELKAEVKKAAKEEDVEKKPVPAPPGIPQPEVSTAQNAFSTFSLNVSDVSFKLAAASLEKGLMPEPGSVRTEEFINAFNYHDPEPTGSSRVAFAWERARYPYAHDRDLVRFSVQTAAIGREPGKPLNIVLLLDNSGSMERADRIRIRQECLRVLASQLQPQDKVSVVSFARTARLWVDGLTGAQVKELPERVGNLTPEGGTNLEEAMNLAYQTAQRHFVPNGVNRVVLLTDGAANLGDVQPESLKKKVVSYRQQGVALDCFGIGWEGYNDDLLEALSRNGDGRYGFVNSPEAATTEFASQLAGALKVAASDVKVQVEWNPKRVTVFRQLGYAKHQLKKEEFRDNKVDAAEIGAAEAGNALYTVQVNPAGEGPLGVVRVRYRVPGTNDYREQEWPLAYDGAAKEMQQASVPLRLAGTASAFSEWLVSSPYAGEVTPEKLIAQMTGVPEAYPADPRPKQLEWMIRQAKSLSGR